MCLRYHREPMLAAAPDGTDAPAELASYIRVERRVFGRRRPPAAARAAAGHHSTEFAPARVAASFRRSAPGGVGAGPAEAARAFYRDTLRGREVWRTGAEEPQRTLSFVVAGTLVDVPLDASEEPDEASPVVLYVDEPDVLAERCWDAGSVVRVHGSAAGRHLSVTDPFGRRVDLLARRSHTRPRRRARRQSA